MFIVRKGLLKSCLWGVFLFALVAVPMIGTAEAAFPDKTIEVIVGWGAGGGTDLFTRTIVEEARKILKTNIVVINMPGASSAEATNFLMRQPPDGYTLLGVTSDILMNPYLGRTSYNYDAFTPILRAHVDTGMLHTAENSKFKKWEDVVAYAKKNPGKVTIGVTGSASFDEVATAIVLKSAGIKVTMVPFEGSGEMHAGLLGGHLDLMYDEPAPVMSLVEAKKIRPLIVMSENRLKLFPEVPTVREFKYDMPPGMWRGIIAKKGTPPEVIAVLEEAFKKAAMSAPYKAFEEKRLLNLRAGYLNSKDFSAQMKAEAGMYKKVMKELGYFK